MSVSGGGRGLGSLNFDQIDVQHIDAATGVSNYNSGEDVVVHHTYDIAGGLARGEYAELVALRWAMFLFGGINDTHTVNASVHGDWQLGVEGEALYGRTDPASGQDWDQQDLVEVTDGEGTEQLSGEFADVLNPGVWVMRQPHNWLNWENGTAGSGGAAGLHMDHEHINFREFGGYGPVYDRHNDIHEHYAIESESAGTDPPVLYRNIELYWVVHDNDPVG